MPQAMLDLCAHVAAYEPILLRWQDGDYSEHVGLLNFPAGELHAYLLSSFSTLKAEQSRLLRRQAKPEDGRADVARRA